jgi:hypothetical protein
MKARQLPYFCLCTNQETFAWVPAGNETKCAGNTIMNEVQFLIDDQGHIGQELCSKKSL